MVVQEVKNNDYSKYIHRFASPNEEYIFSVLKEFVKQGKCKRRNYAVAITNLQSDFIYTLGVTTVDRECIKCSRINQPHNYGDYSKCPSIHAEEIAITTFNTLTNVPDKVKLYLYGIEDCSTIILDAYPCHMCKNLIKDTTAIKSIVSIHKL